MNKTLFSCGNRTNKKKHLEDEGMETIQKCHRDLRASVKTSRRREKNSSLHPKYGRWSTETRCNVDQVPLPFVVGQEKTYKLSGSKQGNVKENEKREYDEDVDVYFQDCAWMDEKRNLEWVHKPLIPGRGIDRRDKVLFADNICFQLSKQFHEIFRKRVKALVYLLPANHTDKIQPIDAGFGKAIKDKIGEAMERWLENGTEDKKIAPQGFDNYIF
eukprot:gene972-285_t